MSRVWDNVRDYGVGTHSPSAETIGTTMHGGIVAMSAVLKGKPKIISKSKNTTETGEVTFWIRWFSSAVSFWSLVARQLGMLGTRSWAGTLEIYQSSGNQWIG